MAKNVKMGVDLELEVNTKKAKQAIDDVDKAIAKGRVLDVKVEVDDRELKQAKAAKDALGSRGTKLNLDVDMSKVTKAKKTVKGLQTDLSKLGKTQKAKKTSKDKLVESLAFGKDNGFSADELKAAMSSDSIVAEVKALRQGVIEKNTILKGITQEYAQEIKQGSVDTKTEVESLTQATTSLGNAFKSLKSGDIIGFVGQVKKGVADAKEALKNLNKGVRDINLGNTSLSPQRASNIPQIEPQSTQGVTEGMSSVTSSAGVATRAVTQFGSATSSASSSAATAGSASSAMAGGLSSVSGAAGTAASGVTAMGGAIVASGGTILIIVAAIAALAAIIGVLVVKLKLMLLNLRLARDGLSSLGRFALDAVNAFYNFGDSVDFVLQKLAGMKGIAGWVGQALTDLKGKIDSAFTVDSIKAFSDECTELYSNLTELQNVINNVFPSMSDEINKFAKTSQSLYGLTELQAKQGAAKFGGLLQSTNLGEEVKVKASLDMTTLAADLASFYNLEYDEAVTKLSSGLIGETEPLRQVGINMNVAEVEQWAQSVDKLSGSWANLTSSEQYMLRYEYLMSNLAVVMGDFSNTQFTWANQFKLMGAGLEDIKTKLGYILMQVMYPILIVANQIVTLISTLLGGFVSSLGFDDFMMEGGGGALAPTVDTSGVDSLGDSYDNTAKKADKAKKASEDLAGVFKLNNLNEDNSDSGSGGGAGGTGGFGGGGVGGLGVLNKQDKELPKWLQDVKTYFEELKTLIEEGKWGLVGEKLAEGLNVVFDWLVIDKEAFVAMETALDSFIKVVNGFIKKVDFTKLGKAMASWVNYIVDASYKLATGIDWLQLGIKIGDGLTTLFEKIDWNKAGKTFMANFKATFSLLYGVVTAFDWVKLGTAISGYINGLFEDPDGLIKAAKFAATLITGLFEALQTAIKTTDWKQVGKTLKDTIVSFLDTIDWEVVFTTMVDLAIGMIEALTAFFGNEGEWKEVTTKIKDGVKAALEKAKEEDLSGEVKEMVDAFFGEGGFGDAIQDLLELIDWVDVLSVLGPAALEAAKSISKNFLQNLVDGLFEGDLAAILLTSITTLVNPALGAAMSGITISGFVTRLFGGEVVEDESLSTTKGNGDIKSFEEVQKIDAMGGFGETNEDEASILKTVSGAWNTFWEDLKTKTAESSSEVSASYEEMCSAVDVFTTGIVTKAAEHNESVSNDYGEMCSAVDRFTLGVKTTAGNAWNEFWYGVETTTNNGTGEVTTRTGGFSQTLTSIWQSLTNVIGGVWGALWSGENSIVNKVVKGAAAALQAVGSWFASMKEEFIKKKDELFKKWSDLWKDIKEYPGKKAGEIKQAVADAFEVAKGAITDWIEDREEDWVNFWTGLPNKIGNIGETIKKKVGEVLSTNIFSGLGAKLSGEINSAELDSKSVTATMNYAMGSQPSMSIPKLARGGVIKPNSEFMAILGDQKSGVNVETPLSTMVDAFNTALMGSGFGAEGDTNIEVYINDERKDDSAVTVRKQTFRSNGRN